MLDLTKEEMNFILNLITQVRINPLQEDAIKVATLAQSVVQKITTVKDA